MLSSPINAMVNAIAAEHDESFGEVMKNPEYKEVIKELESVDVKGDILDQLGDLILKSEEIGFKAGIRAGMRLSRTLETWIEGAE